MIRNVTGALGRDTQSESVLTPLFRDDPIRVEGKIPRELRTGLVKHVVSLVHN
jgi:hypothetical protein